MGSHSFRCPILNEEVGQILPVDSSGDKSGNRVSLRSQLL